MPKMLKLENNTLSVYSSDTPADSTKLDLNDTQSWTTILKCMSFDEESDDELIIAAGSEVANIKRFLIDSIKNNPHIYNAITDANDLKKILTLLGPSWYRDKSHVNGCTFARFYDNYNGGSFIINYLNYLGGQSQNVIGNKILSDAISWVYSLGMSLLDKYSPWFYAEWQPRNIQILQCRIRMQAALHEHNTNKYDKNTSPLLGIFIELRKERDSNDESIRGLLNQVAPYLPFMINSIDDFKLLVDIATNKEISKPLIEQALAFRYMREIKAAYPGNMEKIAAASTLVETACGRPYFSNRQFYNIEFNGYARNRPKESAPFADLIDINAQAQIIIDEHDKDMRINMLKSWIEGNRLLDKYTYTLNESLEPKKSLTLMLNALRDNGALNEMFDSEGNANTFFETAFTTREKWDAAAYFSKPKEIKPMTQPATPMNDYRSTRWVYHWASGRETKTQRFFYALLSFFSPLRMAKIELKNGTHTIEELVGNHQAAVIRYKKDELEAMAEKTMRSEAIAQDPASSQRTRFFCWKASLAKSLDEYTFGNKNYQARKDELINEYAKYDGTFGQTLRQS